MIRNIAQAAYSFEEKRELLNFRSVSADRWAVDELENVFPIASAEAAMHVLPKKLYKVRIH